jgi:hypothetical protein
MTRHSHPPLNGKIRLRARAKSTLRERLAGGERALTHTHLLSPSGLLQSLACQAADGTISSDLSKSIQ